MVFQSRDQGSSSGCAFARSLDGAKETRRLSKEFSDAVVTGRNIDENLGLSSYHITVASKDGDDTIITDDDGSLSSNGGSLYTEIRATNHVAESEAEVRARAREQGLLVYHRSKVRLGKQIGKGAQGKIYQATLDMPFVEQSRSVAVKKFEPLTGVSHGHHHKKLCNTRHMYVCKLVGAYFDEDSKLCMIMALYSGDSRKIINAELKSRPGNDDRPPFLESVACDLILQLALGLEGLHQLGIYHRDLKAENILVRRQDCPEYVYYDAFIADFESSYDIVGTRFWRAPEVLQAIRDETRLSDINWQAADVYSFGMVCYEILTGKVPFPDVPYSEYDFVISGDRPKLPYHVPGLLKDIILRCWDGDPGSRPSFTDILESLKQADGSLYRRWRPDRNWTESLESDVNARTAASNLLLVKQIVSTHMEAEGPVTHLQWSSKFVATAEQFESEFGWKSYRLHPTLPFATHVERARLSCLLSQHFTGFVFNFLSMTQNMLSEVPAGFDIEYVVQRPKLVFLVLNIFQELTEGLEQCYPEMDEELLLSEKLTIVEAFVTRLLYNADVQEEVIITWLAYLLHHIDPEFSSPEVVKLHDRMSLTVRARAVLVFYVASWVHLTTGSVVFSVSSNVLMYLGCGFREGWCTSKLLFHPMLFGPRRVPLVRLLTGFASILIAAKFGIWIQAFLIWVILALIGPYAILVARKLHLLIYDELPNFKSQ